MPDIAERIKDVCHKLNRAGRGVLNPAVCPYCYGCPIATIVIGITGDNNLTNTKIALTSAKPIPPDDQPGVNAWLDKIESSIKQGRI